MLVDAHPFKEWYETHYGVKVGVKKGKDVEEKEAVKQSKASCARLLPGRRDFLLSLLLILVLDKVEGVMELFLKDLNLFSTRR